MRKDQARVGVAEVMSGGSACSCSVALMHGGGSALRPEAEHGGAYSTLLLFGMLLFGI